MSSDCPAADAAIKIRDAILRANLIGAHFDALDFGRTRAPLQIEVPRRFRIPRMSSFDLLVAVCLLAILFSSLIGCGGRSSESGTSPSPDRRPTAASPDVVRQVDAVGLRLIDNAVRVQRWQQYRANIGRMQP